MNKLTAVAVVFAIAGLGGCKDDADRAAAPKVGGETIEIDGSSTVFPISQAVAEEFQEKKGGRVTIGVSGTGGGFKKFCRGETAITGASRPIKASEREQCARTGVEFVELPVAYDGLAVVVNPKNDWARTMTVAELKTIWEPEAGGAITKWSQVRTGWPDEALRLFAPGVDSGTYDYFTKAIVGTEHASRGDFTSSEDDNVLVQGVSSDPAALGFFGFAYYSENRDALGLVAIDPGTGPVEPSLETIADGSYQPLSRPIFIYVSVEAAERPEVAAFMDFFLTDGPALVGEVGYVPLPATAYELVEKRFAARTTGSLFEGGSKVGVTVEEMLSAE